MMKKLEEKYKKLTDLEHCLIRPSMYIGSVKQTNSEKYIIEDSKIIKKNITYNPGFLKLLDEIVTNSIDESKRPDSKLNIIKIFIDRQTNKISIWDNGGIPVEKHKIYKEYIPEMVFSNMKSGSNFSENEEKTWAGTNGVGSVITNIFSKEFSISTCDGKNAFNQVFSNNMRDRTKPIITKSTKNHTEISYIPDLERFGMTEIDNDNFSMLEKRIYDLAATNTSLKIYFNGKHINFKSFEDYIKLYTDLYFCETSKDKHWSIGIGLSDNGFQQVSFANSTDTYDGGTHVDYIMSQITLALREFFLKKYKVDIKPSDIKSHMFLFLNSTIINPLFSSQTKEKLITEPKEFGYTFEVSQKIIQQILKSEIVQSILDWIDQKKNAEDNKLQRDLNKKLSKIKVEKLIDAKGKDRWKYSLALFEGDCLHENTNIRVLRDGDIIDTEIKNINIDDMVITHNNSFSNIYGLTKKIKKKSVIKIKDDEMICSRNHEWFIYDKIKNEFYFEKTFNLDKNNHKLVKNYLAFTQSLLKIKFCDNYSSIILESDENITTKPDHEFAVYNMELNKFEMVSTKNINIEYHFLVNTLKL